ncbi:hypothetical protein COT72_03290 [archaeon CG10_big_fil_rev_8_21_14_0_10_43_11]|nr:MAG: hypothetical protein COT72_03290 [archaeon CG10_big_fil_rev_8_21_14_0_10_43_11]
MSRRGQIIASAVTTLAIAIILGYAMGTFAFRLSSTSGVPNYKEAVLNAVSQAETVKLLLQQERNYVMDRSIFYIASRGGFGLSFEKATRLAPGETGYSDTATSPAGELTYACGKKTVETRFVPEKDVPYYSLRYDTDSQYYGQNFVKDCPNGTCRDITCIDYPPFDFVKENFLNLAQDFYQKPTGVIAYLKQTANIALDLAYDLIVKGLTAGSDSFVADWRVASAQGGISFDYGDVPVSQVNKPLLTYEFDVIVSSEVTTPFSRLYRSVQSFVNTNAYHTYVEQALEPYRTISGDILLAQNCQQNECESTIAGDTTFDTETQLALSYLESSDEYSLRALYCTFMAEASGCNPNTCQIDGVMNGCFFVCMNPQLSNTPGCFTPKDTCEIDCPKEENIPTDKRFVCACDDWECPAGKTCTDENGLLTVSSSDLECAHVGWYPQTLGRALDGNMVEIPSQEILFGESEATRWKWYLLRASNTCNPNEPLAYKDDACCTIRYEPPTKTCNLASWTQAKESGEVWTSDVIPQSVQTTCTIQNNRCNSYHIQDRQNAQNPPFACFEDTINTLVLDSINTQQNQNMIYQGFTLHFADEDKSQLSVDAGETLNYQLVRTACTSCQNGAVSDSRSFADQTFRDVVRGVCVKPSDPCGCYTGSQVDPAQELRDPGRVEIMLETCITRLFWKTDVNELERRNLLTNWLSVYDLLQTQLNEAALLAPNGASCTKNSDCDVDLATRGQDSICVYQPQTQNSVCTHCTGSLQGQFLFDSTDTEHECTPSQGWVEILAPPETACTDTGMVDNQVCDSNLATNGLRSACVKNTESCNECTSVFGIGRTITTTQNATLYCVEKEGLTQWVLRGVDGQSCISDDRYCDPNGFSDGLAGYCDFSSGSGQCKMCDAGDTWSANLYDATYRCNNGVMVKQ